MKRAEKPLINIVQILRIVGLLLLFESLFLLFPTVVCLIYEESDWLPFAATTVLTGVIGLSLLTKLRPASSHIGKRDGFLLTAMVWVVFSIFGMIPFLASEHPVAFSDAFFEAMSGFTTTGASTIPSNIQLGHGMQFWQALMQWIGGMGIILFTLAVVPMLNHSGGMQMFNAEVTGITHDKIRPRISQTAKTLWMIYIALTIILIALLYIGPLDLFSSICLAFGAVSTGGFATQELYDAINSSPFIKTTLIVFMFFGGMNFGLIFKSCTGNFSALRHNDVFRSYLAAIVLFYLLFVVASFASGFVYDWQTATIDPLFNVVSILTSSGYTPSATLLSMPFLFGLMFIMMFSGSCAGSTSGGAKIDRMLILAKHCRNEISRCIHPNTIKSVRINGKVIPSDIVNKVIVFLCLYVVAVLAGGILISLCGIPIDNALFSALSCMCNTGTWVELTPHDISSFVLPDFAKWILAMLMLIGRLEIFTVLVLFSPAFWRK